ncbi:MAG: XTP/dITP diphosphatase [Congregibacter sp.]
MNKLSLPAELVIASGNRGKLAEFQRLFSALPVQLHMQSDLKVVPAEETGETFVENAILKARAAASQTGMAALADDSGLEVDALMGAPGVRSARYASSGEDRDNVAKLLNALEGVPDNQRSARFHCVLVIMRHAEDPVPLIAQGRWEGRILKAPQGDGGFGYDPVFFVPTHGVSAAELGSQEKNTISHRGIATAQMLQQLGAATATRETFKG